MNLLSVLPVPMRGRSRSVSDDKSPVTEVVDEQPPQLVRCLAIITLEQPFHSNYQACKKCKLAHICFDCAKQCHRHLSASPKSPRLAVLRNKSPHGRRPAVSCGFHVCECPCRFRLGSQAAPLSKSATLRSPRLKPLKPVVLELSLPFQLGHWYSLTGNLQYTASPHQPHKAPLSLVYCIFTLLPQQRLFGSWQLQSDKPPAQLNGQWTASTIEFHHGDFISVFTFNTASAPDVCHYRKAIYQSLEEALTIEPVETALWHIQAAHLDWPSFESESAPAASSSATESDRRTRLDAVQLDPNAFGLAVDTSFDFSLSSDHPSIEVGPEDVVTRTNSARRSQPVAIVPVSFWSANTSQLEPHPPSPAPAAAEAAAAETTTTELAGASSNLPELLFTSTESGKMEIKGGSLWEITNALFDPPPLVSRDALEKAYILTCFSFTNPSQLIDLLHSLFETSEELPKAQIYRLRLCNFYIKWVRQNFQSLRPADIEKTTQFANEVLQRHDMDKTRQTLLNALNPVAASTLASSSVLHSNPPPEPIFPSAIMPSLLQISLMNVSPLELARQLTIYVHTVYRRISPLECVITSFTGPEKEVRSPNLTALTTMFNDHSYWAASYILNSSDLVHRVQVLEFFITVAVELRTLQNFMTMYAILCGIRSTPVRRLKLTWERVSKSKVQQFDALVEIMQSNGNFASYRNLLRQALPPVCPYIGTFLTDLVFIEEGNPDFLKEQPTFINFCKRIRSAQIVQKILHYCQEPYNLVVIPAFQEMFTELIIFDENRRYELSYALEARGSQQ